MKSEHSIPTMKDVAKEAGVALGTVSKVVNGIPVGESYRLRVEEAIKKLNYQVNSYAQGLKANKTYTAALLLPNTEEPFFASLAYHINLALLKRRYRMLLCCTDFSSDQEQEYVTMAQQNKVDGIIGLTYNPNLQIEENTPSSRSTALWDPKSPAWRATTLPAVSLPRKSWRILAAPTSPSCASAPRWTTNQTNAKLVLKTAVSRGDFPMK